jgi:glyoxylase-like metal-dependent hydrolase (beta-lactamase superfamily II)
MLKQVAEGVFVHKSELLRNNSVVVQGGAGALLIDPGITTDELVDLANEVHVLGQPVAAGFATHPDWDHALWLPELGDAPRYGTARGVAALGEFLAKPDWRSQLAEVMPPEVADEVPLDQFGLLTGLAAGAAELPWDGPRIRILEHNAHAAGHAALLIEERGVLVAGDMLSDVLIPMLDLDAADPIGDYLAALQLLESVAGAVEVVIPGHGSVDDAAGFRTRLDQDRAYVEALRDGRHHGDIRLGSSAEPGWEWVGDVHAWQVERLAAKSSK